MRPEERLILACARSHHVDVLDQVSALLDEGIDWDYLLKAAQRHRMLPLLYACLQTISDRIPTAYWQQVRTQVQNRTVHSLALTKELLRLLNLFEMNGIPAVPYKGPVLAANVYGNLTLRPFGDLASNIYLFRL